MRFLVDECTGPAIAAWLRGEGHDVYSVYESARGIPDQEVIRRAYAQSRILITNDKDFGEKIFRERHPHCGVVLFRLSDERTAMKISALNNLLKKYSGGLSGHFVVASEEHIRFARGV